MGIPSFFSYIIHEHSGVLCTRQNVRAKFRRLYMDCNSILYDCFREIPTTSSSNEFESMLLEKTARQIEKYIYEIQPDETVYIAFDGVAPVAKMEQQRTRRYKSWFETCITNTIEQKSSSSSTSFTPTTFTTSMFTPGTTFMNRLSQYMKQKFQNKESRYKVKRIIVATPDEPGEGEHKLYTHLRQNPTDEPCAIYGLDADLMMLSLFHLSYCANMYIFREAPQFAQILLKTKKEDVTPTKDEPLFIDVAKLGRSISHEMRCSDPDPHRMYDYVFLCFFLGNDFLPHFPSLNIRTSGITALLDTYRANMGKRKECFLITKTNPPQIQWREVSCLITELAKNEKNYICQEYAVRKKWDKTPPQLQPKSTTKMRLDLLQNTPVLYRHEEHFINPHEKGWEDRYYKILFPPKKGDAKEQEEEKEEDQKKKINQICVNYIEGLEWVFQYYLLGEVDWEWKYNYHYPPLLKDLALLTKTKTPKTTTPKNTYPVSAQAQLAYVLPPIYHHLLPEGFTEKYKKYYDGYTINHDGLPVLEFQWAFCRYFWESHLHLPSIPLDILKEWNNAD